MFSSIESNAFDDYYEMYMGTKGTLIMNREQDALLFEEGSAASRGRTKRRSSDRRPRNARGRRARPRSRPRRMSGNTNQAAAAPAADGRRAVERPRARLSHHDSTLLLGRPRRHAALVRARQGVRFRAGVHPRQRSDQAEDAADHMTPNAIKLAASLVSSARSPDQAAVRLHDAARVDHPVRAAARARGWSSTIWRGSSRSASSRCARRSACCSRRGSCSASRTSAPPSRRSRARRSSRSSRCSKGSRSSPRASPPSAPTRGRLRDARRLRRRDGSRARGGLAAALGRDQHPLPPRHQPSSPTCRILHDMMQRAVDYWDRVRRFYFRDVLIHRTRLAQAEHRAMLVQMRGARHPRARADHPRAQSRRARRLHGASRGRRPITTSGSGTHERGAVRPRRGAQDRGRPSASPRVVRDRPRLRRRRSCRRRSRRSAQPFVDGAVRVGNRFCILPMEGWDGTTDGEPSDLTRRRWQRFGASGAKLIWGGEAVAVRHDGRANPNQLLMSERNEPALASLRDDARRRAPRALRRERRQRPVSRPAAHALGPLLAPERLEPPRAARRARQPGPRQALPRRRHADDRRGDRSPGRRLRRGRASRLRDRLPVRRHQALPRLLRPRAAERARPRPAGTAAALENRTRFLRASSTAFAPRCRGLGIGVRLSVVDSVPYRKTADGPANRKSPPTAIATASACSDGRPAIDARARRRPRSCSALLQARGIRWVCLTAGSPYYCPHVVRPALFPPTDGYEPPEDPLHGVARQIARHGEAQGGVSGHGLRRLGLHLSCRSGCRTSASTRSATG